VVRTHQDQRSQEVVPLVHGRTTESSTGLVRNSRKHIDAFGAWSKHHFDLPSVSLSDLIWAEVQRSSTNRPAFGTLSSWPAERSQPSWDAQYNNPTHLNVFAIPTVSRHGLQPIDCQGKTAGATSNFKTPRADGPDNRRRRASRSQRMDKKSRAVPIFGILQALGFLHPW